jgi:hypothetical protein
MDYFGHWITQEGLNMDDDKVKAILDWEPPRSVLSLRLFLRLASYYYKFIKNFAKIVTRLTNLLKKSFKTYEWDEECNEAFETLKCILVKALLLKLLDFNKDFEIHFDGSNFAIGGVLMQDGRAIVFKSKKLTLLEIMSFATSHYATDMQLVVICNYLVMFATINLVLYNFSAIQLCVQLTCN